MFRRLESGLPKDASYPASLEGLGYIPIPTLIHPKVNLYLVIL